MALSSRADDMVEFHPDGAPATRLEFEGIVYSNTARMKEVVEFVQKIAPSDAPVLILGESGTGKELIAKAIHRKSPRSQGPFVAVNCAGLTESLVTSQLFGHRRGAFTGAVADHQGFFEAAQHGTRQSFFGGTAIDL